MTVTSCIDCGTTILGERPRCPRCHDAHARELASDTAAWSAEGAPDDDAVTAPRPRRESVIRILLRWLVVAQGVAAIVLGAMIVLTRGCR